MSLLSDVLRTHLIPWSRNNVHERFIVARHKMNARQLPSGVRLSLCPHMGQRVIVKKSRAYRNMRNTSAGWPEAQLNEVAHYKLVCILAGHANFQINNAVLHCGPGTFILIPPGMPHPVSAYPFVDTTIGSSCDILYIVLYDDAVQSWINRCRVGQRIQTASNCLLTDESIAALMRLLMKEGFSDDSNSPEIAGKVLQILFELLQRQIEAGRFQNVRGDSADDYELSHTERNSASFAARLERFIESNLHKPLTLEMAAHEMYLSRSQFALVVRRETGQTFNNLLVTHRIEAAKALLSESQWTVGAIADYVGFKSPSYFRTFFHKHTGMTPTEFRNQNTDSSAEEQ